MKNLATTKYFSNINNYLFYTSQHSWDISLKYKNLIESLKLQCWMKLYINKAYHPFLKKEQSISIFRFGKSSIPHPDKLEKGGEDAFYQSKNLLVVADGVGGWNQHGIDPSAYSKKLCQLIHNCCAKYEDKHSFLMDIYNNAIFKFNENIVKSWLIQAVSENKEKGSSTVCVLYLDKLNKKLYSSYIGDSSYLIARPVNIGEFNLTFKSEDQSHGFNIPYQVGTEGDNPVFAKTWNHNIETNDLVLVASDGLWDNIDDNEIIRILNDFSKKSASTTIDTAEFAKILSLKAEKLSRDKNHFSPFCRKAMEYSKSGRKYMGGKPDDITIIAAQVILSIDFEEKEISSSKSVDTTFDDEI